MKYVSCHISQYGKNPVPLGDILAGFGSVFSVHVGSLEIFLGVGAGIRA